MTSETTSTISQLSDREQLSNDLCFENGARFAVETYPNRLFEIYAFGEGKYIIKVIDVNTGAIVDRKKYAPKTVKFHVSNSRYAVKPLVERLEAVNDLMEGAITKDNDLRLDVIIANEDIFLQEDEEIEETAYDEKMSLIEEMYEHTPKGSNGFGFYDFCEAWQSLHPETFMETDVDILRSIYMERHSTIEISISNEPTIVPHKEGESLSEFFDRAYSLMSESEKAAMTTEYEQGLTQEEMFQNNETSNVESMSDLDIERQNSEPAKQTMRIGGTVDNMTGQVLLDTMQKLDISKNEALSMAITLLGSATKDQLRDALGYVYAKRLATIFED